MRLAFNIGFWLLCSVVSPAAVKAQPSVASGIYTCTDASGRRLTADRPIAQCADREQRVLGPTGVERNRIGPALTEAEMAQRLEAQRNAMLQQQRMQEQRRRDAALLARYPDRSSHDGARRDGVVRIKELIAVAQMRLTDLEQEKQQLLEEQAFYAKDPSKMPARLQATLQDIDRIALEQRALIEVQTTEIQRAHKRFDAELLRLQPLWNSQTATPLMSAEQ